MKTVTKSQKAATEKPRLNAAKSNLKAAFGKYKGIIIEKDDCWDEDLKKTIAAS